MKKVNIFLGEKRYICDITGTVSEQIGQFRAHLKNAVKIFIA